LIRKNRQTLQANEFHSNPSIYNNLKARFRLQLGFLTQGYQEEFYYWEVVLLLRKTLLVLMMTFLAPISAGVQSLTAILILILFLVFHIYRQPFYDSKLNNLEATSLFVQICIIYFGLFYQAGRNDSFVHGDGMKYSLGLLIAIVSAQFVTLFVLRMRLEMMKATVEKHSCCFRILSCGRVRDKKAFMKEHKVNEINPHELTLSELIKHKDDVSAASESD